LLAGVADARLFTRVVNARLFAGIPDPGFLILVRIAGSQIYGGDGSFTRNSMPVRPWFAV
jgi:hypothetical protein